MLTRAVTAALIAGAAATLATADNTDGRIRVRAVVTDARGEPLAGLRPRDFDLSADGVAQEVESAHLATAPSDAPRVFALFLDDFHVDAGATQAVRDALTHFVDTHVRPTDLVFALRPLDPLISIEPARDSAHVKEVIAAFQGRKGDYTPRAVFEEKYMPQAPAAVAVARAQIVTSALRALALRVSDITDARAAIVFVSDGFDRVRTNRESPADLQAVIRPANGAAVPVYAVSASAPPPVETVDGAPAISAIRALAAQTGGELTTGAGALTDAMARVSRDLDTHYVLTYRPSHGEDGRFHSLRVDVKRTNARIRTRSGYLAPMSLQMRAARAAAATSSAVPRALRRSSIIHAWSGFTRGADGSARVTLTWEPRKIAAGVRRPSPEAIVLTASTPGGEVLFHGRVAPVGRPNAGDARASAVFDAPAGRLLVDMNILDAAGGLMDVDARDLDVPDLRKPGTLLPVSVLRARSAREFREVSADPDAPPAASREFRRTDRLLLRVPAYDGAGATVTATLLNGWRQPMRALRAMPESSREGVTQFDVPLAPLAPGEYVIRITGPGVAEHLAFRVTG